MLLIFLIFELGELFMKKILALISLSLILTSCISNRATINFDKNSISNMYDLTNTTVMEEKMYLIKPSLNNNNSGNILFTDLNENQTIYLCNRAECEHIDDSCTSFLNDPNGVITMLSNKSVLLYTDIIEDGTDSYEALFKMDLNGQNRELIYSFKNGIRLNIPYRMAEIGNNIYFIVLEPSNNNGRIKYSPRILELNIDTLQSNIIPAFNESVEILGANSTSIFFLSTIIDTNGEIEYSIESYDLISHKASSLYSIKKSDYSTITTIKAHNNNVYIAKSNGEFGSVSVFSLDTLKETLLSDCVPVNGAKMLSFFTIIDELIIFDTVIPDTNGMFSIPQRLYFNTNDKSYGILSLKMTGEDSREFYVGPIGKYNNSLIVVNSNKLVKNEYKDPEGNINYAYTTYSLYSMMDKNDYINNIPKYKTISHIF